MNSEPTDAGFGQLLDMAFITFVALVPIVWYTIFGFEIGVITGFSLLASMFAGYVLA